MFGFIFFPEGAAPALKGTKLGSKQESPLNTGVTGSPGKALTCPPTLTPNKRMVELGGVAPAFPLLLNQSLTDILSCCLLFGVRLLK
jgi:hypothetical protein